MKRNRIIKMIGILAIASIVIGGGAGLYLFNKPHRDVQLARTDYSLTSSEIVAEYLSDYSAANRKYLAENGESKILEITGEVNNISEDYSGRKVVLLKSPSDDAGVSATFTPETGKHLIGVSPGQILTVKGVIRSGATYDEDLELFENVVLDKSDVVRK